MKLGRNEKCWCGSGKKYKKCHLYRDQREPVSLGEAHKVSNAAKSKKYCSVPEDLKSYCSNKIINAHTVSKSSGLLEIADSTNHVLGLRISLSNIQKGNGTLLPEKIGVNQASTFKGFCSEHDKQLFSCIEDQPFSAEFEQLFALAYRALCKEIYEKGSNEDIVRLIKESDKGKDMVEQLFSQNLASAYGLGVDTAIKELAALKDQFDSHLLGKEKIEFCHFVIESDTPCPVAVSSILCPDVDFEGNAIQDLSNLEVVPECVIFNSFSSDGKGYVVFSWLRESEIIESFVGTLPVEFDLLKNALLRFFFSVSENIYISPEWWGDLTKKKRKSLTDRVMIGVNPFEEKSNSYLCDDNINYDGWEITSVQRKDL
ncbi:MAG: SEC-C domain-containing protein [Alteromonadaceae bacterium]|nr:SEC-C domain-containing protein [Alteromonadaceae bacterium]